MVESKLTLGYWKSRGVGHICRSLLHYTGADHEEKQYEVGPGPEFNKDSWFSVKFTLGLPFPNLPYIIDGDVKITESLACQRYICHKYNPELLGKTLADKANVDMVGLLVQTFKGTGTVACYKHDDKNVIVEEGKKALEPIVAFLGDKKFLIGDYPTMPDFALFEGLEMFDALTGGAFLKENEKLAAFHKNMMGLEKLAEDWSCSKK